MGVEMSQAYQNNDKTIYKVPNKDWKDEGYMPKLFITREGLLGIEVGGMVHVLPIETWHRMAKQEEMLKGLG
jgi:hypothetical protein